MEDENEEKSDDCTMAKWSVCVKETEDDDWDVLDNDLHDDKGSARQASAGVRDEYEKRKIVRVRYNL